MAADKSGDHQVLYWLLKFIFVGPLIKVLNRPKVEGRENIPKSGPALLAGNHLSIADWLFTPLSSPRRISYLAKSEYFTTPGFSGWLQRFFYTRTGQVPVNRTGGNTADDAMATVERLLAEDRLVEIYPEGTRSPDGRLYRGRTGLARVALAKNIPVIPVGVVGTNKVSPPGPFRWRAEKVSVTYGTPIDPADFRTGDARKDARALTDHIMSTLQAITGQEYVDEYARKNRPDEKTSDSDASDEGKK